MKSSGGLMVGVFPPSFNILSELCAEIKFGNRKFRWHWGMRHLSEEFIFSNFLTPHGVQPNDSASELVHWTGKAC